MPEDTKTETAVVPQEQVIQEDLPQILKKKTVKYTLLGEYEGFPKELTFRRWPYGACIELVPLSIEIFGAIGQYMLPEMGQGTSVSIFDRLSSPSVARELTKQFGNVKMILARTILLEAEANGFKGKLPEEVFKFVENLEFADVIQIINVLYQQNLEHAIKNVFGPVLNVVGVTKKSA